MFICCFLLSFITNDQILILFNFMMMSAGCPHNIITKEKPWGAPPLRWRKECLWGKISVVNTQGSTWEMAPIKERDFKLLKGCWKR